MDENIKIIFDCGQKFYVIDIDMWENIYKCGEYEGTTFHHIANSISKYYYTFLKKYSYIFLAITRVKFNRNIKEGKAIFRWVPILFYKYEDSFVRCDIVNEWCKSCSWKGIGVDISYTDNYFFVFNGVFKNICNMNNYKKLYCPMCGEKTYHHIVDWINC